MTASIVICAYQNAPIRLFLKATKFMKSIHFVRTECVGFTMRQHVRLFCPIDCIKTRPQYIENKEQLLEKFKDLNLIGSFSFLKPFRGSS